MTKESSKQFRIESNSPDERAQLNARLGSYLRENYSAVADSYNATRSLACVIYHANGTTVKHFYARDHDHYQLELWGNESDLIESLNNNNLNLVRINGR